MLLEVFNLQLVLVNFPKQYSSQQPLTVSSGIALFQIETKTKQNNERKKDITQQEKTQSTMKYTSALMGLHIEYQNHKTEAEQFPPTTLDT
jgi:hypothetical protein